jgi:hypothetical protein
MDSIETESYCSSNPPDSPKDYSLSSSMMRESEENEIKRTSIKSMELNFGVDRLLAKCDKVFERKLYNENLLRTRLSLNRNDREGSEEKSFHEKNVINKNGLNSNCDSFDHNFVLRPFALRIGSNENGKKLI